MSAADAGGTAPPGTPTPAAPRRRPGEYVVAAATTGLGIFVLADAGRIVVPGSANTLGPRAFPYLVGALLVAAGIGLVVALVRGRTGEASGGEDVDPDARTDKLTVALLVAVLVVHVFMINLIGWPFAAAILFGGAAWVLGARPWWRPLLVGVVLGLVIQVVFGGLLGLSLPPGPLLDPVGFLHG